MKNLILFSLLFLSSLTDCQTYLPDLSFAKLLNNKSEWRFVRKNVKFHNDSSNSDRYGPIVYLSENKQIIGTSPDEHILNELQVTGFILFNQLPISINESAKLSIEIETLLKQGTNCWIVVKLLDKNENTVCSDSINIKKTGSLKSNNITMDAKSIKYLYLELRGKGDREVGDNEPQLNIGLGNIKIDIDGQSYKEYQKNLNANRSSTNYFSQVENLHINNDSLYHAIEPFFSGKKVIALAETVHGSFESTDKAFQIIKTLIKTKEYDLVFLELPISELLIYNAYIQGSIDLDIDSLVISKRSLCDPTSLTELLAFLKGFNQSNGYRVTMVGIDRKTKSLAKYDLFSYLQVMLDKGKISDTLLIKIGFMDFKGAIEYIKQNESYFLAQLGDKNLALLLQSLQYKKPDEVNIHMLIATLNNAYRRDEWMWENTQFAINNLCRPGRKAVIYCHYGHANKINTQSFPFHRSLGFYLEKQFGNTYHVCAIIVGGGSRTAYNNLTLSNQSYMQEPIEGSLEQVCSKTGHKSFIASLNDLEDPIWMRSCGNQVLNIFECWGTKNRMDSFIYIDKVRGFDIPPEWMAKNFDTSFLKNKENELKSELLRIWRE